MRLEDIVWDAREPRRLGGFWAEALGAKVMLDEPDIVEARVQLSDEVFLDLCFPRVDEPSAAPTRLHPDLRGGPHQTEIVERLLGLGAVHADIGQGDVPWTVLADPERDARFWAAITGWVPCAGSGDMPALRHPDGVGPLLELCPEPEPSRGKNSPHLDVRPAAGEDLVARATALGARRVVGHDGYPWQVFTDPSGNEFCVLEAPAMLPDAAGQANLPE